jgi:hypothetical protein
MRLAKSDRFSIQSQSPNFLALPGMRKKPRAAKVTIKEKDLQAMAENLCLAMGIRFFRIPDKLLAFLAFAAPSWTRVFVARYLKGLPDMLLFKKTSHGLNFCKMIEIKTEAGKLSAGQTAWHFGLSVHTTYGWEATEKAIKDFIKDGENE